VLGVRLRTIINYQLSFISSVYYCCYYSGGDAHSEKYATSLACFKHNLKITFGSVFRSPWTFPGRSCWRHCVRLQPRDAFVYPHPFRFPNYWSGSAVVGSDVVFHHRSFRLQSSFFLDRWLSRHLHVHFRQVFFLSFSIFQVVDYGEYLFGVTFHSSTVPLFSGLVDHRNVTFRFCQSYISIDLHIFLRFSYGRVYRLFLYPFTRLFRPVSHGRVSYATYRTRAFSFTLVKIHTRHSDDGAFPSPVWRVWT